MSHTHTHTQSNIYEWSQSLSFTIWLRLMLFDRCEWHVEWFWHRVAVHDADDHGSTGQTGRFIIRFGPVSHPTEFLLNWWYPSPNIFPSPEMTALELEERISLYTRTYTSFRLSNVGVEHVWNITKETDEYSSRSSMLAPPSPWSKNRFILQELASLCWIWIKLWKIVLDYYVLIRYDIVCMQPDAHAAHALS